MVCQMAGGEKIVSRHKHQRYDSRQSVELWRVAQKRKLSSLLTILKRDLMAF